MDAAGLLRLVTCRPRQRDAIHRLRGGCEEPERVEVAARDGTTLHKRVYLGLWKPERRNLRVAHVVAAIDHRPLVHSVASKVRRSIACRAQHMQHVIKRLALRGREGARVSSDHTVDRMIRGPVEALTGLGAVNNPLVRSGMPRL